MLQLPSWQSFAWPDCLAVSTPVVSSAWRPAATNPGTSRHFVVSDPNLEEYIASFRVKYDGVIQTSSAELLKKILKPQEN